jgi:hypothetical protein
MCEIGVEQMGNAFDVVLILENSRKLPYYFFIAFLWHGLSSQSRVHFRFRKA